jgi:hypothetical protein
MIICIACYQIGFLFWLNSIKPELKSQLKNVSYYPTQRCPRKMLDTKGTGSENLVRAIDEYWERFEKKGNGDENDPGFDGCG